mgnify:CR=1 FL=1
MRTPGLNKMPINFDIIIDDTFANYCSDAELTPIGNKHILSLVNDFEESEWRYDKFQKFIWNNIAETALSEDERRLLNGQGFSSLTESAKNLRLLDAERDETKGSELAEIVLYGLMKHHYNALPVVPKIFYKQNANDYAKGADSVHIVLEGDNDFSIWFGEAKFYNSIDNTRLPKIIESVENSLKKEKLKKENRIITGISDIDLLITDDVVRGKIKDVISQLESIDALKPKLHIPILLLHECKITQENTVLTEEYIDEIKAYHTERANSFFAKQIAKIGTLDKYSDINFHIILFPVPDKSIIVDDFVKNVQHFKGQ